MKNYLKFWGTRGSCAVSGREYLEFGGNTCCLEVQYENTRVILDAGTGIRPLGDLLTHEKKIHLIFSHTHWDHIIGFPFFEPLYQKGTDIHIWAPPNGGLSCEELFHRLLRVEFFPVNVNQLHAKLYFYTIETPSLQIGPLTFDFHPTCHPGLTLCMKIKTPHETIGYITDNEIDFETQADLIAFHRHVDCFIHEAQYTTEEYDQKKGWGHSPLSKVIRFVEQVHPKQWLVTHHDPKHTDADLRKLEALARSERLPCPVEWISDGYVFPLK